MQVNRSIIDRSQSVLDEKLRILVVDDDEVYLQLARRILARCGNNQFDVQTVVTGEDAIQQCRQHSFDVLLLDYHLGTMTGLECLDAIRCGQTRKINMPPAILCTAEGSESTARQALRAEADDYLPKAHINENSLARSITNVVTKHRLNCAIEKQFFELKNMNSQLEKKNREISHFYQTISHEVKTPLASAREFLSLVRDGVAGSVNEQQVELLEYALVSCDQLTRHFDDLVDMTKLDLKKLPLEIAPCSIDDIVQISMASCAGTLRNCGGKIQVKNNTNVELINADQDRVVQVLSNLIGNAIKYTSENPEICIEADVTADERSLMISVQDNGCGVSEEDAKHIFDKLYQAGTANVDCLGAGLGLGLSIAREIVTLHGGRIWIESEVDVGSKFSFTLPFSSVQQ